MGEGVAGWVECLGFAMPAYLWSLLSSAQRPPAECHKGVQPFSMRHALVLHACPLCALWRAAGAAVFVRGSPCSMSPPPSHQLPTPSASQKAVLCCAFLCCCVLLCARWLLEGRIQRYGQVALLVVRVAMTGSLPTLVHAGAVQLTKVDMHARSQELPHALSCRQPPPPLPSLLWPRVQPHAT